MMRRALVTPVLLGLLAMPSAGQELGVMEFPEGELQHVVRAQDTPWQPCPETLPPGCEMAVLDGDPQSADLFTVRFRARGSFVMPPHWHPKDERVTVISGSVAVAFGAEAERRDATEFGPGDYYVNARNAVHQVWIEGPAVLQITGIGPWKAVPFQAEAGDSMGRMTEFAERYTAAWCSQDPSSVAAFYSAEGSLTVNDGEPAVGRDAITEVARGFMTAFPDMVVRFDGLEERDGRVLYHWTLEGTNSGPDGTGNRVRISGYESWRLDEDGLIAESKGHFDEVEYRRQLEAGDDGMAPSEQGR